MTRYLFCLVLFYTFLVQTLTLAAPPKKPTSNPIAPPTLRIAPPLQNQPIPKKPEPEEPFRSVDLSKGIPTSLPFAPPKRPKRPARRKRRSPYPPLPTLQGQTNTELLALFQRRHWDHQRAIIHEFVRRGPQTIPFLESALQQKRPRIQLLAAITLAKLKQPTGLPVLVEMAERFYDQAGMLILGGFLAYGLRAEEPICRALKTTKHPHLFLQALGMLQISRCHRILLRFLDHPQTALQQHALNALHRMPRSIQRSLILRALRKPKLRINTYANLLRMLPNFPSNQTIATLMYVWRHKNPSLRFLARILLQDLAAQAHKRSPKTIPLPPRRPAYPLWKLWQQRAAGGISAYVQQLHPQPLAKLPTTLHPHSSWVMYRLLHPLFGVGWMPLLIHDARWKHPKISLHGKYWKLPLPPKEYSSLLQALQKKGFFRLYPNTGYRREITISLHGKKRTLRTGEARDIDFEEIEAILRKLAKRAKIGLLFRDLFQRRDEDDIFSEGVIGQWALRSLDLLPPAKWTPLSSWKGMADIESVFSALRAMFRYIPSRTRLASVDIKHEKVRTTTLLFGARELSRLTLLGLERAQRLRDVKPNGISISYLAIDKIEQAIFDMRRLLIPQGTNTTRRFDLKAPWLPTLQKIFHHPSVRVLALSWETPRKKLPLCKSKATPTPHRICRFFSLYRLSFRIKLRDHHALLQLLSRLAQHSRADRVVYLRINPSGFPDRDRFSIILQAHIEMLAPLQAPKPTHNFLAVPPADERDNPFLPLHP